MIHAAPPRNTLVRLSGLFIDGENLSAGFADDILSIAQSLGGRMPDICRVYGGAEQVNGWFQTPGLVPVYTQLPGTKGKNSADIRICVDIMDFVLNGDGGIVIIASSDGDFTPLAWHLRKVGCHLVGIGEAKAPLGMRAACNSFHELTPKHPCAAADTDDTIYDVARRRLGGLKRSGNGYPLDSLAKQIATSLGITAKDLPDSTWRGMFERRSDLYDVTCTTDGKHRVHLRQ